MWRLTLLSSLILPLITALRPSPIFPLSLLDFPPNEIDVFSSPDSPRPFSTTADLPSKYPAYNFTQLTTHFSAFPPYGFNRTFQQRYWIDTQYYKPTGPVVVIEGGEADASGRLPTLDSGLGHYLAKALNGVVILLEHRYYGKSIVSKVGESFLSPWVLQVVYSLTDQSDVSEPSAPTAEPFSPPNSRPLFFDLHGKSSNTA